MPYLSANAKVVLERRYLAKDREGNPVEKVDQMFRRVARNLAQADREYRATEDEVSATEEKFYRAMKGLEFLPNSPTLMNAGRELQQLSACFVLPVKDSLDSIFEMVKATALIHKSGGGHGLCLQPTAPRRRCSWFHRGHCQRAGQLYTRIRHRHRRGEAGGYTARGQHGHPPCDPS